MDILAGFNLHGVDIGVCCHDAPDDIATGCCSEYVRMEAVNNLILHEHDGYVCDWLFFFLLSCTLSFAHHAFFHNSTQLNSFNCHPSHSRQTHHSHFQPHSTHFGPMSQPNEPAAHGSMKPVQVKLVLLGMKYSVRAPFCVFWARKKIAWRLAHSRLNKSLTARSREFLLLPTGD